MSEPIGSGSGGGCGGDDGEPDLLVEPSQLYTYGFYGSLIVLALMIFHYMQERAKAAHRAHKEGNGGSLMRYFKCQWLEAEFEGASFNNFVITLCLEAVLNATNTANTHLEGDLFFANDPSRSMIIVSWGLSVLEVVSLAVLIAEIRRSSGRSCWCYGPYGEERNRTICTSRAMVVQTVTWLTLVHDAFQISIASVATASQVAANGLVRSAMFINAIEVTALVFVKLFNLYNWDATWERTNAGDKLGRKATTLIRFLRGARGKSYLEWANDVCEYHAAAAHHVTCR